MKRATRLLLFGAALRGVSLALAAVLLGGCASVAPQTLQPFTTDGCSRFPDRAPIGKADWCHCCVTHDLAYWRGGTSDARLAADQALKACVQTATGNRALADLMFAGVRAGGGPELNTSYRWGYGWPYGRNYQALSVDEQALAAKLEREYFAGNPTNICTK